MTESDPNIKPIPTFSIHERPDLDAVFRLSDGTFLTGREINEMVDDFLASPEGAPIREHYIDGTGPKPEPLFRIPADSRRLLLGNSEVDVTDVEPWSKALLDLSEKPPNT